MKVISIDLASEYLANALDIYVRAFPSAERHPVKSIIDRISCGKEQLYGAINDSNEVIGIAMLWQLVLNEVKVLDYFAIDDRFRGRQFGQLFLTEMINDYLADSEVLVLEIEDPYFAPFDSPEFKRLQFYRKFAPNEYPFYRYRMPNLSGEGFVDMRLLTIGNQQKLSEDELDSIVLKIYKQMYSIDHYAALEMIFANKAIKSLF